MSYQVLARKWRPKTFDDVIAQDHVTNTLKNAIKNNRVAQAYLLTGTRGVGKTTIARIFAKSLMCPNTKEGNPCLVCDVCKSIDNETSIDYTEIDGASNNGVDNIRDLNESVKFLPASSKYKIYVIDEVHMLSTQAFNALLKTLEEPPPHIVFIFATTDPERLLGTVLSRCQRLSLRNVPQDLLVSHIKKVSSEEGIKYESDEIINTLARLGNGSVRDTLSLLDQVLSLSLERFITEETINLSIGLAKISSLDNLVLSVLSMDKKNMTLFFHEIMNENVDLKNFARQFIDKIYFILQNSDHKDILLKTFDQDITENLFASELLWIYETFLKEVDWALSSFLPEEALELIFLKLVLRRELIGDQETKPLEIKYKKKTELKDSPLILRPSVIIPKKEKKLSDLLDPDWIKLVEYVTQKNKPLGINLEKGYLLEEIRVSESEVYLSIAFPNSNTIFYDFITDPNNKKAFMEILSEFFKIDKINLHIKSLREDEEEKKNFKSHSEVERELKEDIAFDKKTVLLNNEYLKEAKLLFNAEIKDVKLNE